MSRPPGECQSKGVHGLQHKPNAGSLRDALCDVLSLSHGVSDGQLFRDATTCIRDLAEQMNGGNPGEAVIDRIPDDPPKRKRGRPRKDAMSAT